MWLIAAAAAAVVAVISPPPASAARSAAPAPTAKAMRAYLATANRPYALFQVSELLEQSTVLDASGPAGYVGADVKLLRVEKTMRAAIGRVSRIKAPTGLVGPQRELVTGLRLVPAGVHAMALAYRDDGSVDGISFALDQLQAAEETSAAYERSWGQEIAVVLRRLHMPVPVWVKQAGR